MLHQTVTHYAPWDGSDDDRAVCGHWMTAADVHSAAPTCADCGAAIAAEDAFEARVERTALPLDADEAARELDPVLNTGAPDLFAFAVSLTRSYANTFPPEARLFAGRRLR